LRVNISPDDDKCIERLTGLFVKADNPSGELVCKAVQDSYKRLLKPSIEMNLLQKAS